MVTSSFFFSGFRTNISLYSAHQITLAQLTFPLTSSLDGLDHSHGKKEGKKSKGTHDLLLDDISIQSSAAIKRIIETANQMV